MKEIKLNIEGMHCTGCSNRLEKVLKNNILLIYKSIYYKLVI